MLILLFCAAVAVAQLWPDTALGRALRHCMIDLPARKLAELTVGRVLFVLLLVLFIAVAIALARTEYVVLLQGVPEGIAWFATFDIATYLDVIALAVVLGATVRLRATYAAFKAWVARSALGRLAARVRGGRGARSRAPRVGRRLPPPSNDDEPAWPAFGLAYG
jgi:hypothetical protein